MTALLFVLTSISSATDHHASSAVAISADGATVYTSDDHDKVVRRWDAATGELQATLPFPDAISIARIDVGANGAVLVVTGTKSSLVLPDGTTTAVEGVAALDQTGTRLVVVGRYGELTVKSVPDLAEVKKVQGADFYDFTLGFDLSPDGRFLALGTSDMKHNHNLEVWDLEQGTLVGTIPKLTSDGAAVMGVSPDGQRVALTTRKGTAALPPQIYDVASGKSLGKLGVSGQVHDIEWTDDGKQLVLATSTGIQRWSADPAAPSYTSYVDGVTYADVGKTYSNQLWVSVAVAPSGLVVGGAYGEYDRGVWGVVRDEKLYLAEYQVP